MKALKGKRTVIVNVVSLIAAGAIVFGVEIDAETQANLVAGALAVVNVVNLVLRAVTDTPILKSEKDA